MVNYRRISSIVPGDIVLQDGRFRPISSVRWLDALHTGPGGTKRAIQITYLGDASEIAYPADYLLVVPRWLRRLRDRQPSSAQGRVSNAGSW